MKKFNALYGQLIAEMTEDNDQMTVCDHVIDKMYDPKWINPMFFMHNWYQMILPNGTKKEFKSATLSTIHNFIRKQIKNGYLKVEDLINQQFKVYQLGMKWSEDNKLVSEGGSFHGGLDYKPLGAFVLKDNMKLYWKPYTYTGSDALTKEEADKLAEERTADAHTMKDKINVNN